MYTQNIHVYIQTCVHTNTQSYIHMRTHKHTYMYTHTYNHTCVHTSTKQGGVVRVQKVTFWNLVIPTPTTNTLSLPLSRLAAVTLEYSLQGVLPNTRPAQRAAMVDSEKGVWRMGVALLTKSATLSTPYRLQLKLKMMAGSGVAILSVSVLLCVLAKCSCNEGQSVFDLWDSVSADAGTTCSILHSSVC